MVVVFGAVLVLAPGAAASGDPIGSGPGVKNAQRAANMQYHGSNSGQYHEIATSSGSNSAWLRRPWLVGAKLRNTIYPLVISPRFAARSPIGHRKQQNHTVTGSQTYIGSQNASRISRDVRGDPQAMIQLGAALGLVYVAFLAVWFWATRFRVRPPRSAPS